MIWRGLSVILKYRIQMIRLRCIVRNYKLQVAQRGVITLPQAIRREYGIEPGQEISLIDLDGVFLLSPAPSEVDVLANKITAELAGRGETLESMLAALREARAEYE